MIPAIARLGRQTDHRDAAPVDYDLVAAAHGAEVARLVIRAADDERLLAHLVAEHQAEALGGRGAGPLRRTSSAEAGGWIGDWPVGGVKIWLVRGSRLGHQLRAQDQAARAEAGQSEPMHLGKRRT